jgi:predicted RNA-binding protein with PUA-like domain
VAYWLIKSEPGEWSWDDQVKAKTAAWDGVSNAQAQKNLRAMQKGDLAFFYHTGNEKRIVGIVEVTRAAYPDPADGSGKLVVVDVKAKHPVKQPVTLADIKAEKSLAHLALVKQARLSVVPIDDAAWRKLTAMAGLT